MNYRNHFKNIGSLTVFLLSLLLLIISKKDGFAQTQTLTLKQALQMAEANYPSIKAKRLYAQSAQEDLKSLKREYIPAMGLHGQLDYATANSLPGSTFSYGVLVPVSGAITSQQNYTPVYGAVALGFFEWAPFSFGQYRARVDEAKASLDYANAATNEELFRQDIAVTQVYLNLIVLEKITVTEANNIERAKTILNVVKASTNSGLRPGVDTSFANAEVSKAKLNYLEAQRNEAEQKSYLADLLGITSTNFSLDTLNFLSNIPPLNALPQVLDTNNHPLLKLFNADINAGFAREKFIMRSYYPKISLLADAWGRGSGIAYNNVYNESFSDGTSLSRYNYAVGVACTFNILDYPRIRSAFNAEKFRTQAIKAQYDEQELNLKNQFSLADERLRIALEQSKEAPIELGAANAAYTQKLAMYNSGLSNIVDITQALYNLNRAETDMAAANNGVWKALLYKAAASGDINLLINNSK
jgi:outer membrane protein